VVVAGPDGERRIALNDFLVRSGVTALRRGELVTAIELPLPDGVTGSAFQRRTRRRGHDLASVTLAVALREDGRLRLAYGSLGPRPLIFEGEEGEMDDWFAAAAPSPTSMRAGPEYRLAMLRVLANRALAAARASQSAA
jgi:carbon-monoxide dehydrogenase medium subunit